MEFPQWAVGFSVGKLRYLWIQKPQLKTVTVIEGWFGWDSLLQMVHNPGDFRGILGGWTGVDQVKFGWILGKLCRGIMPR